MKKNNTNIVTAEEALEILNKPWCTAEDIMKLSGYGENKAAKVRKEINEKCKKKFRQLQDSNLRGQSPVDF